jgi:hypothetical protein
MYLSQTPQNLNIDLLKNEKNNDCYFCKSKTNLNVTYLDDKIVNACYICHIIKNFDKEFSLNVILCNTELTQLEIIQKTRDFYNKNGYIPTPNEIDSKAKFIKIQPYIFSKFKNRENFEKYQVFFTNNISNMLLDDSDDVFDIKPKKNDKKNLSDYFTIQKYEFSEKELEELNKEYGEIAKNNSNFVSEYEINLKKRYELLK